MNTSRNAFALARLCTRSVSQNVPKNSEAAVPARILKLRENQKHFGIQDNTPVYLKGGIVDKMLYLGTAAVIFGGLCMSLDVFYRLTFKK